MATQVLHSFAELAQVLGTKVNGKVVPNKVKAEKVSKLATFESVKEKCGRKASIIWAFLQDQESCKRYGPKGYIIHDCDSIAIATDYNIDDVRDACIKLVMNGHARLCANGTQIKAA